MAKKINKPIVRGGGPSCACNRPMIKAFNPKKAVKILKKKV